MYCKNAKDFELLHLSVVVNDRVCCTGQPCCGHSGCGPKMLWCWQGREEEV